MQEGEREAEYSWLTCDGEGEAGEPSLRFFSKEGHLQVRSVLFIHYFLIKHVIRACNGVLELQVVTSCLISWDPVRMQLLRLLAQVPGSPLESVSSIGLRAVGISSYPGGTPASKLPSESQKTPAARCRRISFVLALHRCLLC